MSHSEPAGQAAAPLQPMQVWLAASHVSGPLWPGLQSASVRQPGTQSSAGVPYWPAGQVSSATRHSTQRFLLQQAGLRVGVGDVHAQQLQRDLDVEHLVCASHTDPIPPVPIRRTSRYLPASTSPAL